MQVKVSFVYPWATFGGVERVLLNRLLAFNEYAPEVRAEVIFFHDSGGLAPLRAAVKSYGIEADVRVSASLETDSDLVFCIDFPRAIEVCHKKRIRYVAECHTSYADNRKYLKDLPGDCEAIVTPSAIFSRSIRPEINNSSLRVRELRNFVPWDISHAGAGGEGGVGAPAWSLKPILFFGRMDKLKDPLSLLDAYVLLEKRRPDEFMLILCGPRSHELDICREVERRGISGRVILLPPVPFSSAESLFQMVKRAGGVFVSPSQGESFGLSAAEAISSEVPVVLSGIEAHRSLVCGFEEFLTYELGDAERLSFCINNVFDNYQSAMEASTVLRNKFSAEAFIGDWNRFMEEMGGWV